MARRLAVPSARVTARRGQAPWTPLVCISNPSPYTHVKSQFPCSISLDFFFFQTVQVKNTFNYIYVLLVNK